MFVCLHACLYVCIHACTCLHVRVICGRMYACMYESVHLCSSLTEYGVDGSY